MSQDEAVLRATPATFIDKKSKASNLYYALPNVPEYPLSKALTTEDARRILDASFRHNPEFVRFEDARYASGGKRKGVVYYHFADSPKFGSGRWAVKNKEVQFQTKRGSSYPWKNVGEVMFIVQAALASLENVAKRTNNEVLANTVAGWVTTREVAAERGVAKREAKELDEALGRHAKHLAYAADPESTLRLGALHWRMKEGRLTDAQKPSYSALTSKLAYDADVQKQQIARKYFRYEDIPRAQNVYGLDHPPVPLIVGTTRIGDVVFGMSTVLVYGAGSTNDLLHISLMSDTGVIDPHSATVGEIRGDITPKMVSDATRVLRAYGFVYLDVPKAVGHRARLIEALLAAGYAPFSETHFGLPPAPRANPRRRRR